MRVVPALPGLGAAAALCERGLRAREHGGLAGIRQLGDAALAAVALVEPAHEALAAGAVEEQVQPGHREVDAGCPARVAHHVEAQQLASAQRAGLVQARCEHLRQRRLALGRRRRLVHFDAGHGTARGSREPEYRRPRARGAGRSARAAAAAHAPPPRSRARNARRRSPGPSRSTSCETWLAPFMRRISSSKARRKQSAPVSGTKLRARALPVGSLAPQLPVDAGRERLGRSRLSGVSRLSSTQTPVLSSIASSSCVTASESSPAATRFERGVKSAPTSSSWSRRISKTRRVSSSRVGAAMARRVNTRTS